MAVKYPVIDSFIRNGDILYSICGNNKAEFRTWVELTPHKCDPVDEYNVTGLPKVIFLTTLTSGKS